MIENIYLPISDYSKFEGVYVSAFFGLWSCAEVINDDIMTPDMDEVITKKFYLVTIGNWTMKDIHDFSMLIAHLQFGCFLR